MKMEKNKNKICVMLSTYNGEKYVKEQIESILNQRNVELILYIRDDGSTDKTYQILQNYERKYNNIILVKGENIGWRKSFMEMVKSAPRADFYSFADQDDIWKKEKLDSALKKIGDYIDEVALYGSNVMVVDEKMIPLKLYNEINLCINNRSMEQLLDAAKMPGGLTYVFTYKLLLLMKRWNPTGDFGHDFICYLLAVLFGIVIYDEKPYVLYRQHGSNQIGAPRGKVWRIKKNITTLFSKSVPYKSLWARKVLMIYPEIEQYDEKFKYLKLLEEYPRKLKNKLALITNKNLNRTSRWDTFCLYFKILTGKW